MNGKFSTKYSSYGVTISKMFPMLDPDIKSEAQRLVKHSTWFEASSSWGAFLTAFDKGSDLEELAMDTLEDVGLKAPTVMQFMPTKQIFAQLIKRATQIEDVIKSLNPYE